MWLMTAAALQLLRSASAQTRYLVTCGALAMMLAAPVVTARVLLKNDLVVSPGARSQPISFDAAGTLSSFAAPGRTQHGISIQMARREVEALLPLVVGAWLVGEAFLLLCLAGGWWRVRGLH